MNHATVKIFFLTTQKLAVTITTSEELKEIEIWINKSLVGCINLTLKYGLCWLMEIKGPLADNEFQCQIEIYSP